MSFHVTQNKYSSTRYLHSSVLMSTRFVGISLNSGLLHYPSVVIQTSCYSFAFLKLLAECLLHFQSQIQELNFVLKGSSFELDYILWSHHGVPAPRSPWGPPKLVDASAGCCTVTGLIWTMECLATGWSRYFRGLCALKNHTGGDVRAEYSCSDVYLKKYTILLLSILQVLWGTPLYLFLYFCFLASKTKLCFCAADEQLRSER